MFYKSRQIVENFRIKANNCYLSLDDYSLSDLKDTILSRGLCNSVLRNIVLQEIDNFDALMKFLKSILFYQVKVLEEDVKRVQKDNELENIEKEIIKLTEQLANNALDVTMLEQIKVQLNLKIEEQKRLKQEVESSKTIIENMKNAFTSYRLPDCYTQLSNSTNLYDVLEVDTTVLDSSRNFIKYISDKFKREAYDIYINSDLTEYFEGYAYQTDKAYQEVLECFKRIYHNLDIYINDAKGIENALSKKAKPGIILNNDIIVLLNKLPDLDENNLNFTHLMDKANNTLDKEKQYNSNPETFENKNQELNNSIAQNGGIYHREAVVAAATYLSEKENVPYFWGGKSQELGLNIDWGHMEKVFAKGNKNQPKGTFHLYGLDTAGFIEWTLNNGGYETKVKDIKSLATLGDKIKFSKKNLKDDKVKAGDLLYKDKESLAIITSIDKANNKIKIAEEKNPREGMVVTEMSIDEFADCKPFDEIVLMENYYQDQKNFKDGGTYEN